MGGSQQSGDGTSDAVASFFRKIVKEVRSGADAVLDPVGHHERGKERKRLKANREKLAAVMERRKTGPAVHVLEGQGPLGSDTVIVDKGSEYRAEGVQVGDDNTPFWDVVGNDLALINTREHIESFFTTHAQTRLVNSNLFAELGHPEHYLSVDAPGIKIGASVSIFRPMSEKDRYEVINPIVAAVKLIGPQLGSVAAAGVSELAKAPSELAEGARQLHDMTATVVDQAEHAEKLVHHPDKAVDIGEPIFIIAFSETGFAPGGKRVRTLRASFDCTKVGGQWGVRIGDISGELLGLVDQLAG